jgi:hypothetical protein
MAFPCLKNGGNTCFSAAGENEFHSIFGGGPSYIVHPSTRRRHWSRSMRRFGSADRQGGARFQHLSSSCCRTVNAARENVLS